MISFIFGFVKYYLRWGEIKIKILFSLFYFEQVYLFNQSRNVQGFSFRFALREESLRILIWVLIISISMLCRKSFFRNIQTLRVKSNPISLKKNLMILYKTKFTLIFIKSLNILEYPSYSNVLGFLGIICWYRPLEYSRTIMKF